MSNAIPGGSKPPSKYLPNGEVLRQDLHAGSEEESGISIFDPVLCELSYRWFSPKGGVVLDPFSGGSVRGIVASKLGRQYYGVDLRKEQIDANKIQGEILCQDLVPIWKCGDSMNIKDLFSHVQADFIFSCPPYADLEVYSDLKEDISNMDYPDFAESYFEIIKRTCELLKNDRFACFVVGEARGKDGNYYGFVPDTIKAFEAAGLKYYNEAILITSAGSLPIRAARPFVSARKLGKTHQNILIFVKGDAKKAAAACGEIEVEFPESDASDQ